MTRAREQHVGKMRFVRKQRLRQPNRLVTPKKIGSLLPAALPPRLVWVRARPAVECKRRLPHQMRERIVEDPNESVGFRKGDFRPVLLPPGRIPPVPGRYASDHHAIGKRINLRRAFDPIEKRLPNAPCLFGGEPAMIHRDLECVVRSEACLFSPVFIEEMRSIEAYEFAEQATIAVVRRCFDLQIRGAEEIWKIVQAQRHLDRKSTRLNSSHGYN